MATKKQLLAKKKRLLKEVSASNKKRIALSKTMASELDAYKKHDEELQDLNYKGQIRIHELCEVNYKLSQLENNKIQVRP